MFAGYLGDLSWNDLETYTYIGDETIEYLKKSISDIKTSVKNAEESPYGRVGDIKFYGDRGDDNLRGDSTADYLYGVERDNKLYGEEGNEIFQITEGAVRDITSDYDNETSSVEIIDELKERDLTFSYGQVDKQIKYENDLVAIIQNTIAEDFTFI